MDGTCNDRMSARLQYNSVKIPVDYTDYRYMYLEKEKSTELYKRIENLMYKYSGKKRMMLRRKITKEDSQRLYGLATLMMVYHHLFCIPERMGGGTYTH